MKPSSVVLRSVALTLAVASCPLLGVQAPLVECPQAYQSGDTWGQNGFFVRSYPGVTLREVTVYLNYRESGSYQLSLTAHQDTFDGPVLGSSTAAVTVAGDKQLPQVFTFGDVPVAPGSTVAFTHAVVSGPGVVFYDVTVAAGCPVTETINFAPPLGSMVRRDGVAIRITGDPDPDGLLTTLTIPANASIHGLNGAFFHSDLYLLNRNSGTLTITARYRCYEGQSCGSQMARFDMPGFSTMTFPDVVVSLFGAAETAGAIELSYRSFLRTGEDLAGYSRVYTPELPRPTNGSSVPAFRASDAAGSGTFLGVANNGGDLSSGFRTNAGVYNPWGRAVQVTFTLYRTAGSFSEENRVGSVTETWGPNEARQINDIFAAVGGGGVVTTDGFLYLNAEAPVFPYVTVIDNVTGDSVVSGLAKKL